VTLDLPADTTNAATSRPNGVPLTVAINAQIDPERAGGVETALNGLIAHLAEQATAERFLLLSTARFQPGLARLAGSAYDVVTWPYPQKAYAPVRRLTPRWQRWRTQAGPFGFGVDAAHWVWWRGRRLTASRPDPRKADAILASCGASVVHFAYPARFGTSVPFLYEPWDLQHRHHPEFFEPAEWRARDQLYREGCEQAALVVTATRWTKRDIVEQYGIAPSKIAVIPRGPAKTRIVPSADEVEHVRRSFGLPGRFAFYPAMTFPHKNHLRLFEALAILRDRHDIRLPLVCTGRAYEPHWPTIQAGVARYRLDGQVLLLGVVPDQALAAIFKAASFLVFPSLFEGLGLPVLEALAYNVPVLASDATCLPEVAGEAARYFDGTRAESIADALLAAERHPDLFERTRQAAPAALARCAWPRAAATFVACYRAVAGVPLSPEQQVLYAEAVES
jgi:glycosyltransferase involved in cell wall biosynthesis